MTTNSENPPEQTHAPLDTPMIHWPRLGDILDEVMHNIERDVWQQEFEGKDVPQDLRDREPDNMSECLTELEDAIRTTPRLREILDEAQQSHGLPDHVGAAIENIFDGSVQLVENALTGDERKELEDLARQYILGDKPVTEAGTAPTGALTVNPEWKPVVEPMLAPLAGPAGTITEFPAGEPETLDGSPPVQFHTLPGEAEPLSTQPEYLLWGITTQSVIDDYEHLTEEPQEGMKMPSWNDLPQDEQSRLVEICQTALEHDANSDLLSIIAENLDWDFAQDLAESAQ